MLFRSLLTIQEEYKLKEKEYQLKQELKRLDLELAIEEKNRADEAKKNAEEKRKKDKELLEERLKREAELKKQQEQNAKDFQDRTNKEFEDSKKASDEYYDHLINVAKVNGQSTEELELQKLQNLLQIQKDYGQSTIAIEDQIALKKKEISDKQLEQQRAQLEIQRQDYSQTYDQIKTILNNAYKSGLITQASMVWVTFCLTTPVVYFLMIVQK